MLALFILKPWQSDKKKYKSSNPLLQILGKRQFVKQFLVSG